MQPRFASIFSAVCLQHGIHLLHATRRPQGLLQSCWGGTTIESWSSKEAIAECSGSSSFEPASATRLNEEEQGPQAMANPLNTEAQTEADEADGVRFAGLIAPLLNFPIRGAIWFQGE